MCGRFVSASEPDELAQYFGAALSDERLESNFNVAPTNDVYAVRANDGQRELACLRWGLVPFWAKDLKIGPKMINARSETVGEKPAFRRAYRQTRCLIPADGFYEWAKVAGAKTKQPYFIQRADDERVVFAGLWERWRPRLSDGKTVDDHAEAIETCTILTCGPNAEMSQIHDRMPVVVPPSSWDDWLSPSTPGKHVAELLRPVPDNFFRLTPVSTAVNRVANNGEELLQPVSPEAVPDGLPGGGR